MLHSYGRIVCYFFFKLIVSGKFSGDYAAFENKIHTMWFKMYERQNGVLGSSGFEHVFIGICGFVFVCLNVLIFEDISSNRFGWFFFSR